MSIIAIKSQKVKTLGGANNNVTIRIATGTRLFGHRAGGQQVATGTPGIRVPTYVDQSFDLAQDKSVGQARVKKPNPDTATSRRPGRALSYRLGFMVSTQPT